MVGRKKKFRWNTAELLRDLPALCADIKKITAEPPRGDYDTTNLIVKIDKGDSLYICGVPSQEDILDSSKYDDADDCEFVVLNDGLEETEALLSKKHTTAKCYVEIRQYFIDRGADVVKNIRDLF